jgi:hypothetical protein
MLEDLLEARDAEIALLKQKLFQAGCATAEMLRARDTEIARLKAQIEANSRPVVETRRPHLPEIDGNGSA